MPWSALGCSVEPLLRVVTDASGRATRLEPKACDLLVLLAGRPNEVVSVEQLIAVVWGGRFVTSDVVTVAVHALRQALGDAPALPAGDEPRAGRRRRARAAAARTGRRAARAVDDVDGGVARGVVLRGGGEHQASTMGFMSGSFPHHHATTPAEPS